MLTSFFFFIWLLNLCRLKGKHYFSHCLVTYVLMKEKCHKNRRLSISKRTRSPFMETDNYLLVSKTAMDHCNFSIVFIDSKMKLVFEEEILYRVPIFVTSSISRIRKYIRCRNFSGSTSEQRKCPSRDFSLTWGAFSSSFCATPP